MPMVERICQWATF